MAMELFVLSNTQLNSIDAWQAAIDSEQFPVRLSEQRPMRALKGFLPVMLRGITTGFECRDWPTEIFLRERSNINFGCEWRYVLAFRWGGDFNQLQSAWMAAAAYAKATGGVVFDDEQGKTLTAIEARDIVRDIERGMPTIEALLRDLRGG